MWYYKTMENKIESFLEEKAVCHTYSSLVSDMASRMVVDKQKIMPEEEDKFDFEDIHNWVRAVDFVDGETPDIEVILSSKQGKERFVFDTKETKEVKSETEKVSKEQLLYSMALTEAKMKVIQDIAEETYPAVAFQIDDYRKEMEKVREEVLEMRQTESSMNEVFGRMMNRRTMLLATTVVIGSLVLSACGYGPETKTPDVVGTPFQPGVTETSPVDVTPEVSETPFVEGTPNIENKEVVEIMKQIDLFLKEESPYTESHVDSKMFKYDGWKGEVELGILNASEDMFGLAQIQGILIGNIETDDGIIMFLGVQDKKGDRFVTPIKIYDIVYSIPTTENNVVGFIFVRSTKDLIAETNNVKPIDNKEETEGLLNDKQGQVLAFSQYLKESLPITDEMKNQMLQQGYINPELMVKQLSELRDNTLNENKNLILNLWCQSLENFGPTGTVGAIDSYGAPKSDPIKIFSTQDILEIIESDSWMPMTNFGYFQ